MKKLTEEGTKARQLDSYSNKVREFSDYFYDNPSAIPGCLTDMDFVFYDFYDYRNDKIYDFALVEVTKADYEVSSELLVKIHHRFYEDSAQADFVKDKSGKLSAAAFIVVYNKIDRLYVWSFQREDIWKKMTIEEFARLLSDIRNARLKDIVALEMKK